MKKLLLCLIACLLATTTLIAQDKTLNLSILIDKKIERTNQEKERLLREIRNVISNDYEVQIDYLLENDYDLQKAKENYLFLEDKNQDIILVIGVVNNVMVYQNNPNFHTPTIVFGSVNRDFIPVEAERTKSDINNLNYLITPISYTEDLNDFYELYPYENVAVLIDDYKLDILPIREKISEITSNLGVNFELIPVDENNEDDFDLSSFDAIYLAAEMVLTLKITLS